MTVAQVWFAIWTAICLFSARNLKKCLLYWKKNRFFNIEDIYNIIQVLQYERNLAMQILLVPEHHSAHRSREAFYIWLYAGLQDTMLAVLSRVLSWYVSQSYLLLDVFFFLSLNKKSFYLHAPDELLWHVGWVSVLQLIKSSSTVCTVFYHHYIP